MIPLYVTHTDIPYDLFQECGGQQGGSTEGWTERRVGDPLLQSVQPGR